MTIEEHLENVERELGRLKRDNRRLLAAGALVFGIMVVAWAFGLATPTTQAGGDVPKEIRANKFVLVDENGLTRATLGMFNGSAGLALYDENGKTRVGLGTAKDGPMLVLADGSGEPRATLDVVKDVPRLTLYDENGKTRAELHVHKGGPGLMLQDENRNVIWSAIK